jgi:predicted nucleic acid-binding protein
VQLDPGRDLLGVGGTITLSRLDLGRRQRGLPGKRHPLAPLLAGAWGRRENQRLVDALYSELAAMLDASALVTTDARFGRVESRAVVIGAD